jgi:hypothetical protein
LERYCAKPLAGKTPLNTAEWWRTDWNFVFTVPVDDDGCISQNDLQDVIADVVASAPSGMSFHDC